jgi:hypothetical protein
MSPNVVSPNVGSPKVNDFLTKEDKLQMWVEIVKVSFLFRMN